MTQRSVKLQGVPWEHQLWISTPSWSSELVHKCKSYRRLEPRKSAVISQDQAGLYSIPSPEPTLRTWKC